MEVETMQFRLAESKKSINILKYDTYSRELKRSKIKRIGSINLETLIPAIKPDKELTDDDWQEIKDYIKGIKDEKEFEKRVNSLTEIAQNMLFAAENASIEKLNVLNQKMTDDIFNAWDELKKQLRKAGYTRSKGAVMDEKDDKRQGSLLTDGEAIQRSVTPSF